MLRGEGGDRGGHDTGIKDGNGRDKPGHDEIN
jgi:hypothetical protein